MVTLDIYKQSQIYTMQYHSTLLSRKQKTCVQRSNKKSFYDTIVIKK